MRTFLFLFLALLPAVTCFSQSDSAASTRKNCTFSANKITRAVVVPVILVGYGSLCIDEHGLPSSYEVKEFRDRHFGSFKNYTDDYLFYSNAALVYGLDLLKVPSKHDVLNQTVIMAKTGLLALGIAGMMKYSFGQTRPDGSNSHSFPSGHSTLAFALAGVVHHEFKDASPWISVLGYTSATATGAMRILNNKHWFSDVLVGAGIGVLSTNLVYLTHRNKFSNSSLKRSVCLPIIGTNYYGLSWQKSF